MADSSYSVCLKNDVKTRKCSGNNNSVNINSNHNMHIVPQKERDNHSKAS